jgi:hypothetical protein
VPWDETLLPIKKAVGAGGLGWPHMPGNQEEHFLLSRFWWKGCGGICWMLKEKSVVTMLGQKDWLECFKNGSQLGSYLHDLCSLIKL